jgi:hypothetical protein
LIIRYVRWGALGVNDFLRWAAPYLAQGWFIGGVALGLLAWAGLSARSLYRGEKRLAGHLQTGKAQLERSPDAAAFTAEYEQVSASLGQDPLLGESWRGFSNSLIVPSVAGRSLASTEDASHWFGLGRLYRKVRIDLRYHAALPGLLVGAGLLFTFLGLAAALSAAGEVVAEGVDQARRNAALRDLLGAASVKFITSLVGLFLSIAYALFRKGCLMRSEGALAGFVEAIQARMPLKTPAMLQADGNAILERQHADLQQIGTDFFVNLGSTLEREFGQGLQQHMGPLAAAIEGLSAKLANQNEEAMQTMLQAFLVRLEGAVGESMRGVATTLETLGGRLDGLQAGLDAAAQRMARAAEEMASGMGRGAEAALGGITEQMSTLVRVMKEAAEEAGRDNRAAGDEMARRMTDAAASMTAAVETMQAGMGKGAADAIAQISGPIADLVTQLQALGDAQRQAGSAAKDEIAAVLARAAGAMQGAADRLKESLERGANDAGDRLVAATEAMRDDLRKVLDGFGQAVGESGAALKDSARVGGDLLQGAASSIKGDLESAAARVREAGEAAGEAIRKGAGEAQLGMTDAARTLSKGSDGLGERLVTLGQASAQLAERAEALDRAVRAATSPLAAGAADLRAAGEAAKDSVAPLREVAQAVRAATDGLLNSAAALSAAQAGADQLAARLTAASERFDGVDKSMAQVFQQLAQNLNGFRAQVNDFVLGMDQGLKRSVEGLGAIVTTLEETLSDLPSGAGKGKK